MRFDLTCAAIAAAAMLAMTPALAADKPTADEAKKVLEFYFHGQGMDPLLVEAKMCQDIQRDGDNKFECTSEISGAVKKGEPAYFWMKFMAPQGNTPSDIVVQYELDGKVMMEKKGNVPGELRSRIWQRIRFSKAGNWKIKISENKATGPVVLGTLDVKVE